MESQTTENSNEINDAMLSVGDISSFADLSLDLSLNLSPATCCVSQKYDMRDMPYKCDGMPPSIANTMIRPTDNFHMPVNSAVDAVAAALRHHSVNVSREFVYYVARVFLLGQPPTEHSPLSIRDVLKTVKKYGGGSIFHPVDSPHWHAELPPLEAFCEQVPPIMYGYLDGLTDAKCALGNGDTVVFTIHVDSPNNSYHTVAAVLVGYDDEKQICIVLCQNKSYYINYADMTARASDFWAVSMSSESL